MTEQTSRFPSTTIVAVHARFGVGAGPGTITALLILAGFTSYVLLAEYDGRRLRDAFAAQVTYPGDAFGA